MPPFLPVHIVSAGIAIASGYVALAASKGLAWHRRSGLVFVYSMFSMCATAAVLAVAKLQVMNVVASLLTSYLVATAFITVQPRTAWSRTADRILMLLVFALGVVILGSAVWAVEFRGGRIIGFPAAPLFVFGMVALGSAAGDFRMLRLDGLRGAPRLARHLWRMCAAMFMASASFFSIRARVARVLPQAFTTPTMRALPVLIVLGAMVYWLWRIRGRRAPARLVAAVSNPLG